MKATIIAAGIKRGALGMSLEESIYSAVKSTLADGEISIRDVDQIAIASDDGLDGRAISSMVTAGSTGAYRKSIVNSSSCGEHALVLAALQIMAGRSRICLVANWAKSSETPLRTVDRLTLDPFFYRPLPLAREEWLELQTNAMAAKVGRLPLQDGPENGRQRESATGTSVDNAVALIVASEAVARELGRAYTTIAGFGWATDSYWRGGAELAELPSLGHAATRAYGMANVMDPARELEFAEVVDFSSLHRFVVCRALRLRSDEQPLNGVSTDTATVVVNPSGGIRSGYLDFADGLGMIAASHGRLCAPSDLDRVRARRLGLIHAASVNAAQANSVFILETSGVQ